MLPVSETYAKSCNQVRFCFLQAFVSTGTNLSLQFFPWNVDNTQNMSPPKDYVNFDREPGKVDEHLQFFMLTITHGMVGHSKQQIMHEYPGPFTV